MDLVVEFAGVRLPPDGAESQLLGTDGAAHEDGHVLEVVELIAAEEVADLLVDGPVQDIPVRAIVRGVVGEEENRAPKCFLTQGRIGEDEAAGE